MKWVKFTQIGLQMLATIVCGTLAGHWLDSHFQLSTPIGTLVGALGSIALALYQVIRQLPKE